MDRPVPGGPEIAPTAPPNRLSVDSLRRQRTADRRVSVDPSIAGWRYLSFETLTLRADETLDLCAGGHETAVVVLGGGGVRVAPAGWAALQLDGRRSVFDGLPWAAYMPARTDARITGLPVDHLGCVDIAVARAPASIRSESCVSASPILIRPTDCAIEVRGAGNATRQITHILPPGFPADRLLPVEVYTPSGNWSSWPPHKHDQDAMPNEAVLEEVHSYRFRRPAQDWAIQRVYRRTGTPLYTSSGPRDGLWTVHDVDTVIVPDGYHPFVTAHGIDAYYLNALAGDRRTMACSFDPDLDFVRDAWAVMDTDPRVPLVDHFGPRPVGVERSTPAGSGRYGSDRSRAGQGQEGMAGDPRGDPPGQAIDLSSKAHEPGQE
jgi:5-deoxy-glucuronate isomerase